MSSIINRVIEYFEGKHMNNTTSFENTTLTSFHSSSDEIAGTNSMENLKADETGAIAGVIFGVLFCLVVGGVAAYLYRKHRVNREAEYRRTKLVHMSSMKNAGVYMETTTTENLVADKPASQGSKDSAYVSLSPAPEPIDSDDEI